MKRFFLLTALLVHFMAFSQNEDSTQSYKRQFGYGVANLIQLSDPTNYKPRIYLDFAQAGPWQETFYRVSLLGEYRTYMDGNVRNHEIIPFIVSMGLEKVWKREKIAFGLGVALYYSMSLRKTTISTFQGDDYGVGIAPSAHLYIPLKENLSLTFAYQYGVGLYREFVGVGTVAAPSLVPRGDAIRDLSFGVVHYF